MTSTVQVRSDKPCGRCRRASHTTQECNTPVGTCPPRAPNDCAGKIGDPLVGSCLELDDNLLFLERKLGGGAFGNVYQTVDVKRGRRLAAKALFTETEGQCTVPKNELRIMTALHEDKSGLFPAVEAILASEDRVFIVMELLTVSVQQRFQYAPPSLRQIRFIFRHMLSALVRLRQLKICHFDVKIENMMLTSSGQVKLIDFSCAYFEQNVVPQMIITTTSYTRAPEVILRYRISHKADMWSLGVAMLQLYLHRKPCFAAIEHVSPSSHEWYMLTSLEKTLGPIPDHLIHESVENYRFYGSAGDGQYILMPYRNSVHVPGCNIQTLMPHFVAERALVDHEQYETHRRHFLDLISGILVYEDRMSLGEAQRHEFIA